MKKYRLTKIGRVGENDSYFGDTQEYFEGYARVEPMINERFNLWSGKLSYHCVISISRVTKIEEGKLTTMYSVYKIEEV